MRFYFDCEMTWPTEFQSLSRQWLLNITREKLQDNLLVPLTASEKINYFTFTMFHAGFVARMETYAKFRNPEGKLRLIARITSGVQPSFTLQYVSS